MTPRHQRECPTPLGKGADEDDRVARPRWRGRGIEIGRIPTQAWACPPAQARGEQPGTLNRPFGTTRTLNPREGLRQPGVLNDGADARGT